MRTNNLVIARTVTGSCTTARSSGLTTGSRSLSSN